MSQAPRRRPFVSVLVFAPLVAATVRQSELADRGVVSLLGYVLLALLAAKLVLAAAYRASPGCDMPGLRVTAAIAVYNEDPDALEECLQSLLAQTRLPARVHVVDDGSSSRAAVKRARRLAPQFEQAGVEFVVSEQPRNKGKREALAVAFRADPHAGAYVGVDSDTVLDPNAIYNALGPLTNPNVQVVTGLVLAKNYRANLLTRLIDLRYGNAFAYERAAYSTLGGGSVLCACGSLAVYRGKLVHDNLEDFLGQTFFGKPAVFGDDRRLTNYGLIRGHSVYQESAMAYTLVPQRFGHYLRQQSRWNKSFFRESLWAIQKLTPRRPAWWLTGIELTVWITYTSFMLVALVVHPIATGRLEWETYLFFMIVLGYARSVRYLDLPRTGTTFLERFAVFLLGPLYGLMHIAVLLPIRLWSLATLAGGKWGTRDVVEVTIEGRAR